MIAPAIYGRLAGFAGLAALVGDQIYPIAAPTGAALPHVVYTEQAPFDEVPDLDGAGDMSTTRVRVDAWSDDADEAAEVGDQTRLALNDFTGTVNDIAVADVTIGGGFDDFTAPTDFDPVTYFRRSTDFLVTTINS